MRKKIKKLTKKIIKKVETQEEAIFSTSPAEYYGWDPVIYDNRYKIIDVLSKKGYEIITKINAEVVTYMIKKK